MNKKIKATFIVAFFILSILACSGKEAAFITYTDSKFLMGTIFEITARHSNIAQSREAMQFAFEEIVRIDNLLSSYIEGSEISKINRNAGLERVIVSSETFEILRRAMKYSHNSNGAFDVSVGPLIRLWGFNHDEEVQFPEKSKIDSLLYFVDFRNIILNEKENSVFLQKKGMELDLGGIAKGYAVDQAAQILKRYGINHFIINGGGDIFVAGVKQENKKWVIGVQHPRNLNNMIATMQLSNFAVATSGDYQRFKIINEQRYHHILNPKTGYPANNYQSVTVLAPTAEEADFFATSIFLVGHEQFLANIKRDISYLVILQNGEILFNDIMENTTKLRLTD